MSGRILYTEDYLDFLNFVFKEVESMKDARLSPSERKAIEEKRERARKKEEEKRERIRKKEEELERVREEEKRERIRKKELEEIFDCIEHIVKPPSKSDKLYSELLTLKEQFYKDYIDNKYKEYKELYKDYIKNKYKERFVTFFKAEDDNAVKQLVKEIAADIVDKEDNSSN